MSLQSIAPLLPAPDVALAAKWYAEVLGFSDVYLHESGDYAIVSRDGVEVHLFRMKINPRRSDFMVYLRVTDIEGLYEEFLAKGVIHPNGHLTDKEWGQREFAVLDPNGALLTFGQALNR